MVVGGVTRGTRRRVGRKCCGRVGLRPRCTSALELTPPASSWAPLHFVYAHLNYSNSTHITSNTVQGMRYHTHTHTSATLPGLCHSPNTPLRSHIRSLRGIARTTPTHTHTHNSQADAPAPSGTCSLLSSPPPKHPHTHTHTAHTRLEGLRNSRAVVVITGRGRPCGLP